MASTTQPATSAAAPSAALHESLVRRFLDTRAFTETLCETLETEDYVVQSMTEASPTRWHLAHTTWFFEAFLLERFADDYEYFNEVYLYLFNSYYRLKGPRHARPHRGLITRPTVEEVYEYRRAVNDRVTSLMDGLSGDMLHEACGILEIGINHEQQHQELLVTDVMHMLSFNPMLPAYRPGKPEPAPPPPTMRFIDIPEGTYKVGHDGDDFAYDNESPRHTVYLNGCRVADRLVTNGEFMRFVDDGGYENAVLWLDLARPVVEGEGWRHPLYWFRRDGQWFEFCVNGAQPLDPNAPLRHVSYFEADAYARWAGRRLPTEIEWEVACGGEPIDGTFSDALRFHPAPARDDDERTCQQVFGELWQWTQSQYTAYPGFAPPAGALGEYNGKFMCNQFVLRGGSVATPRSHIRATYRNFFPPESRWQFSGVRLAEDAR